jgi:hypothetical protein
MSIIGGKNGSGSSAEDWQEREEETKAAIAGLQDGGEETTRDKTELLEELSESDLLDEIDDQALRHLATKDIPTANFDEAGEAEFRAYMDVALMKKRARYPHEGQDVTGILREVVHDDPSAGLQPIDKGDLLSDETFAQAMKARVTKGRGGSLVRAILSSIKHSIVSRESEDSSSGRILGRLKN